MRRASLVTAAAIIYLAAEYFIERLLARPLRKSQRKSAPNREGIMDIYEAIESDHRKVEDLIDQIKEASPQESERRRELLNQLARELIVHMRAEEEVLYEPMLTLLKEESRESMILEAEEEHDLVNLVLRELQSTMPNEPRWMAKVKVLSDLVSHHINEEEDETLKKAKDFFSSDDAKYMAKAFKEAKERYKEELQLEPGVEIDVAEVQRTDRLHSQVRPSGPLH